jgi:Fe-S-cluster containining protein
VAMKIQIANESQRRCGDCQLCCKLLPMTIETRDQSHEAVAAMVDAGIARLSDFAGMIEEFDKPAGVRCPHQRHGKGCSVYAKRPFGCRMWHCRWVQNDDTAELSRPDRSHYVLDSMPDYIEVVDNNTGKRHQAPVIQVWVDPDYPDAHRDPKLRTFLARAAENPPHPLAMIRLGPGRAFTLWAPFFTKGDWWESEPKHTTERQHSFEQIVAATLAPGS